MDISRVVRTLLTHQGRSRAELAQALDVHVSAVNKALAIPSKRSWSANEIRIMADFFDVTPMVFYTDPDRIISITRYRQLVSA